MYITCNECQLVYNNTECSNICPHRGRAGLCVACDDYVCKCAPDTKNIRSNRFDPKQQEFNPEIRDREGTPIGITTIANAEQLGLQIVDEERYCFSCGQSLRQEAMPGEYPCVRCGKPTQWDEPDAEFMAFYNSVIPNGMRGYYEKSRLQNNPRYDTLMQLLDILQVKLTDVQREAIHKLDDGQAIAVYDVKGVIVGRLKADTEQNSRDNLLSITTGNIVNDTVLFMHTELQRVMQKAYKQTFADELFMYLKKRKWDEDEIVGAVNIALSLYGQAKEE